MISHQSSLAPIAFQNTKYQQKLECRKKGTIQKASGKIPKANCKMP
jgi:hypothetical protein